MGKRATIQQVAARAGVSRGTVDRVLNDRSYVSAEVRTRVLDAIVELGYVSPRDAHQERVEPLLVPLRLGILLPNWDSFFQSEIERGIRRAEQELADFRVETVVRRCRTDIPGEAVELLDELEAAGCRGMALCALNDPAIQRRVAELADAGIPCITFNSDLPHSRRLCFVGQDIHRAGRVAAELMGKCVPPDAHILATVGNLKFNGHCQRLEGFLERMGELGFPRDQIAVAETFNDYAVTTRVVGDALAGDPALRGVYMANLSVTACAEAIRAAGRRGQVRVICHDVNESVRRLLREGGVDLTIPQDLARQGYAPLILLRELLQKGRRPEQSRLSAQISVICAENLE